MSSSKYSFRESSSSSKEEVPATVAADSEALIFSIACNAVSYNGLLGERRLFTTLLNLLESILRLILPWERIALWIRRGWFACTPLAMYWRFLAMSIWIQYHKQIENSLSFHNCKKNHGRKNRERSIMSLPAKVTSDFWFRFSSDGISISIFSGDGGDGGILLYWITHSIAANTDLALLLSLILLSFLIWFLFTARMQYRQIRTVKWLRRAKNYPNEPRLKVAAHQLRWGPADKV